MTHPVSFQLNDAPSVFVLQLLVVYACLVLGIFVGVILLFKMTSKQNFSVLASRKKKIKIGVLAQLRSSMSYSAVSCELM